MDPMRAIEGACPRRRAGAQKIWRHGPVANPRHPFGIRPLDIISRTIRVARTRAPAIATIRQSASAQVFLRRSFYAGLSTQVFLRRSFHPGLSAQVFPRNFIMFKRGFFVAVMTTALISVGSCFGAVSQAAP